MRLPLLPIALYLALAVGPALGQQSPSRTAKDDAIPELRDAALIALRHARVIDGTGSPAMENQTVLIEGSRITAVGNDADVKVPPQARVVDLAGRTILPGLVMLHEHLFWAFSGGTHVSHPLHFSYPLLYLSHGVTTLRTAGTDFPYMDKNVKQWIDAGEIAGPEIHLTGPYFSGEGDPFYGAMLLHTPEEARRAARYWAAEGFTWFKAYQWVRKDVLAALIDEAHHLHLRVTAHLRSVSCLEAAEMGIDNIEHGCFRFTDDLEPDLNGPRTIALLQRLVEKKVALTATPTNGAKALPDAASELFDPSARERLAHAFAYRPSATTSSNPQNLRDTPYAHLLTNFVKAGGRLVLGSDAGSGSSVAGFADHEALENLANMGLGPLVAIRIATLGDATFLGIQDRTGTVSVGKEADLFIVRGNPSQRIEDVENVEMVINNGIAYDPKTLTAKVKGQVGWQ